MQYNTRTYKGKLYMICQNSIPDGKYWQNKECKNWSEVSARTTAVLCSACTMELLGPAETRQGYVPSGRPRGWQFMKEYVDPEGNVFHKGIEQPTLKGTLPATQFDNTVVKSRLSKQEKEDLRDQLLEQMVFLRGEVSKSTTKKDIRTNQTQLKKVERQLKKLN